MFQSLFASPVTKRHIEKRILWQTNPWHLFRIIQDVDQYQHFLPLCSHSQILRRLNAINDGNDDTYQILIFEASLTVGLPPFLQETYVSRVTVDQRQLIVQATSIQSLYFVSLRSQWHLKPLQNHHLDDNANQERFCIQPCKQKQRVYSSDRIHTDWGCHVDFSVEITAHDPLIIGTLDQVLEQVAGQQVDAFVERCRQIPVNPVDERRPERCSATQ